MSQAARLSGAGSVRRVDVLTALAIEHGIDGFVLWSDGDPVEQAARFAEIAEVTRSTVAAARGLWRRAVVGSAAGSIRTTWAARVSGALGPEWRNGRRGGLKHR